MKKILVMFFSLVIVLMATAQKRSTKMEFHNYKVVNNKIVIQLIVNGVEGNFLLDLIGRNAIMPDFLSKIGEVELSAVSVFDLPDYRDVESSKKILLNNISFGDIVFSNGAHALVLEGESANNLKSLGVDGVINGGIFKNSVLTIDKKNKRIITSEPYRPPFIRLTERIEIVSTNLTPEFSVSIGGKEINVLFDTWQDDLLLLNNPNVFPKSYQKGNVSLQIGSNNYGKNITVSNEVTIPSISLVNVKIENVKAPIIESSKNSFVGLGLLDYGLMSIDFGKGKIYFQDYESTVIKESEKVKLTQIVPGKLNDITKDDFIEYIYDYKSGSDFKLKGHKPVIIDFWAPWCAPCMRMMPTMERLAVEYKDQIIFYKVNADLEKELCAKFNVVALPTMFFINPGEAPSIEIGDQSEKIMDLIKDLKINTKQ